MRTRAYRRLPKLKILAAPLGARTRFARQIGVFSVCKAAEKTDLIIMLVLLQLAFVPSPILIRFARFGRAFLRKISDL